MSNAIKILFEAEEKKAVAALEHVGDSARHMADKVEDSAKAHTRLGEKIGSNEQKFIGTADLLDGLGASFGLPTDGATQLARGLGDLSGGFEVVSGLVPSISGMMPGLSAGLSTVAANPLILGILAGGAIIVGLVLLEKKFGLVSKAVGGLGEAFGWAWENGIKPAINLIIGGVELMMKAWAAPFTLLNKIPGVKSLIPDGLANIHLPRLDVGGTVLQTGIAVVHRGEVVTSATGTPTTGGGLTVIVNVGGSVISESDLVKKVRDGLARDKRVGG